MLRRGLVALCASVVMAFAGQAAATVMTANLVGSFDPLRLSPSGEFVRGSWTATLTYDTSFGAASEFNGNRFLDWSPASGGTSPLTSATLVVNGFDGTSYNYGLDTFTGFNLTRSIDGTALSFEASGFTFLGTSFSLGTGHDVGADLALDAAYFYSAGLHPISSNIHSPDFNGSAYTDGISIARAPIPETGTWAPIPEPEAWALMILGFLGVGVMIRRQRAYLATS